MCSYLVRECVARAVYTIVHCIPSSIVHCPAGHASTVRLGRSGRSGHRCHNTVGSSSSRWTERPSTIDHRVTVRECEARAACVAYQYTLHVRKANRLSSRPFGGLIIVHDDTSRVAAAIPFLLCGIRRIPSILLKMVAPPPIGIIARSIDIAWISRWRSRAAFTNISLSRAVHPTSSA
jgi:hypothetical protein